MRQLNEQLQNHQDINHRILVRKIDLVSQLTTIPKILLFAKHIVLVVSMVFSRYFIICFICQTKIIFVCLVILVLKLIILRLD
jgi:hypothetical protein